MLDYRVEIIDHYKHPRNFGELEDKNLTGKGINAACGDVVEFYLKEEGGVIKEARWRGVGCAMSTASASILSEFIIGKKVEEMEDLDENIMRELVGEINLGRLKCVMLPLSALKIAIKK